MNESTEGVTILSAFVFDVLREYQWARRQCEPMFQLASGLDPARTDERVPIALYNALCAWAEEHMGVESLLRAGRNIGARAYTRMVESGLLGPEPTPREVVEALQRVARTVIEDPDQRSFELLEAREGSLLVRRTQTFNCMLQQGNLLSLVERTRVALPTLTQVRCTRRGDPFCEYEVRWAPAHR